MLLRLIIALLICLTAVSCYKPAPLTGDELMRETLGTAVSLEKLSGIHSVYGIGFAVPLYALNDSEIDNIDEKDWYDGTRSWDVLLDKGTVKYKVSMMRKKGLGTVNSFDASFEPTASGRTNSHGMSGELPGTSRGLRLGDRRSRARLFYGPPTKTLHIGMATNYQYKAGDYTLDVLADNNSGKITSISVTYMVDETGQNGATGTAP